MEIPFKNKVVKAELEIDASMYDFLYVHYNGAINDISFNDENHSLLVECDYYERSKPEPYNPLTKEQEQYILTLEMFIAEAKKQNINEIELGRG